MGYSQDNPATTMEVTTQQPGLFDHREQSRFEEYHAENPHVYEAFKRFTLEVVQSGRTRIGARMIIERLRWESMVRSNTGEYKLNDHYTPFFVRLFIREFPQHEGLFSMRKAKADEELGLTS